MAHDYAKKTRSAPSGTRAKPKPPARRQPAPRQSTPRAPSSRQGPSNGVPGWLWLVAGVAMGAFIMFLVRLADVAPDNHRQKPVAEKIKPAKPAPKTTVQKAAPPKPQVKSQVQDQVQSQPAPPVAPVEKVAPGEKVEPVAVMVPREVSPEAAVEVVIEPEKPRFDFYQMLKENEVPVVIDTTDVDGNPIVPVKDRTFILQVASYRKAEDAEALKVELILLNLTDARTETVTVRNGEQWTRVLVGPFKDRSSLAKARSTLLSNRHEALMMEVKESGK